jgi:hypothetical protein
MEETLKAIEKEAVDVRLLRRDLDAGLAKAVIVLDETKYPRLVAIALYTLLMYVIYI